MKKSIFLFFAAILCATSAWAVPGFNQGNVFFDKSGWDNNSTYIYLAVGHDSWTSLYRLDKTIANTQLVKGWCSNNGWWNGMTYFAIMGSGSSWSGGAWGYNNIKNASHYTGTNNKVDINNSSKPYLCTKSGAQNGATLTITEKSSITDLNYKQTIQYALSIGGTKHATMSSGKTPGKITMSSYKFVSNYDDVSEEKPTALAVNGTTYSREFSAAHTATTKLTVSEIAAGYKFDGWYTAATGGTELSTSTTYTYYPTAETTIYARFSEITYYVAGTFNEWKEADATNKMTLTEGIYTKTLTLPAGEHKLKVTNGTWNNPSPWGYDHLPKELYYEGVTTDNDKNIVINLTNSTEITINFNSTTSQITIDGLVSKEHIYTIVGPAAMLGTDWDLFAESNKMTKQDENTFVLVKEVILAEGDYQYKAVRNNSYSWEVPQGDNKTLHIEESGRGNVTFTLKPYEYTLEAKVSDWVPGEVDQTVVLTGINENVEFTEAPDSKSTSAEITLEANQVYAFNIIVNGTWMYNTGNMWRENCTEWTFELAGLNNEAHIITDLAGTYIFTWTYESNKLSVKYPDGTNVPAPIFLAGKMNGWDRLATRLIPSTDGTTASATIELERNVYNEFRMIIGTEDWTNKGTMDRDNCTGWTFDKVTEENKDDNAGIVPDATGEYIFTWSYAENKLSVTYPEETCTDCSSWYLCGSFNEWGLANEFTKADDKIVTTTVRLEAGEYEFKVQDMTDPRDGKWWGNKGKMQRNSDGLTTGWTFEQKSGDEYNCTIVADIAGYYTFTWNTDTKKLTVQYPTLTITLTTGNNDDVIAANIGNTVDVVIERSFTANDGYYTLCVPFNMDPSVIGKAYYLGDDIKKHVSGEGIDIELVEEKDMLLAGVPYLVLPKANMSELVVENVTIQSDPASGQNIEALNVKIFFEGFYSAPGRTTNGTTEYYVGNYGYLYNGEVEIRGLSGLFTITDTNGEEIKNVRARVVANENVETGVEDIITTDAPVKVIENGQLIIIRGGVKYNVQGVRL